MDKELKHIEQIEQYVRGQLEGEALIKFEEMLESDSDLQKEVALFRDLLSSVEMHGKQTLNSEIDEIGKELKEEHFFEQYSTTESKIINMTNQQNSDNSTFSMGKILSMAAAVALLLTAGYFLFNQEVPVDTDPPYSEIYTKIYKPESNKIGLIIDDLTSSGMAGSDDPQADSLATGLALYKEHKYVEARSFLAAFVEKYPTDHTGRLYLGLSLLQQSEYAKASRHLQAVSKVDSFEHKDIAEWYLAQAYLMFDTVEGKDFAKKIFNKIAGNTNSPYQKEAVFARDLLN